MALSCTLEQPEKFGNVTEVSVKKKEKCLNVILAVFSLTQLAYFTIISVKLFIASNKPDDYIFFTLVKTERGLSLSESVWSAFFAALLLSSISYFSCVIKRLDIE